MRPLFAVFLDWRYWLVSALSTLALVGVFAVGFKANDVITKDYALATQLGEERERNDRLQAQLDALNAQLDTLTKRQDALVRQQDVLVQRLVALEVISSPPVPLLPDDTGNILAPSGGGETPKVE